MDRDAFDGLTKLLAARPSRRSALAALVGAALLTPAAGRTAARGKNRRKGRRKPGHVTVCHGGETLRVPREAVRAIKIDGGSVGACPPGAGGGRCVALGNICDVTGIFGAECCGYTGGTGTVGGVACTLTVVPGVGTCQFGCSSDDQCKNLIGSPDVVCTEGANCFLSPLRKCCFRRRTDDPASCASGKSCRFGNVEDREFECCLPGEECDLILGCV